MLFMNVHDVADHELYRGPWADPQPSRYPYRPPRGDAPFKLAFHNADTDTDILAEFCARILARMSVRDACVYTCIVLDKLSCTRLQNYTIGAPLMSMSVPCNSSFTCTH